MTDEYARHLAALHAGFEVPSQVVTSAVGSVTRSPVLAVERIVHGEANEVYGVSFESGLEVILRIARRGGDFEREAWAIGKCRSLGVMAPEVLALLRLESSGEPLEVCILEKLPGRRLADCLSMSQETMRAILWELGEQISRIHSIRPQDLGEGELLFENDVDEFFPREAEFLTLGGEAGLDRRALERAFRFVEAMEGSAEPSSMRLTHNDLRACHVLVHDGHLSGLIDFGQVSIASPVNELAKWAYWEEPSLPLAWLQEGYGDKSIFNETYPERLAAYRIVNALWVLRWYALTGYGEGVSRAAASIARDLSAISPR